MTRSPLEPASLDEALSTLPQWSVQSGKLHREYRFTSFGLAIGFMVTAAMHIEKADHHPEWSNVYNRVVVDLITHDAEGITERDIQLASFLESLAARFFD